MFFCLFTAFKINLLKEVQVTRREQLTPKAKRLYTIATHLKRISRKLDFDKANGKARLKKALDFVHSEDYLSTKVNKVSLQFILCQLREQHKKPRGRRYTLEEKVYALSLLKVYKVLQKAFALPSRKTLISILNKVPFHAGINVAIMNNLKFAVDKMEPLNRYCSLLFDEMTVDAALTYIKKGDFIQGFEFLGETLTQNFADHAMVFMARGLRKKWKQPVAYFFSEHGMRSYDLIRNLKYIIRELHKIGLHVISIVCDQHANNTKAINYLKELTNKEYLKRNMVNKTIGFTVDREIIPIYDPPHLLKGIRNNMLNSSIEFSWKKKSQIATWADIVQLYELDTGDTDTRMLTKLTDYHIYPEKVKKMKVKYAAQVFSHRVSSTMRGILKLGKYI